MNIISYIGRDGVCGSNIDRVFEEELCGRAYLIDTVQYEDYTVYKTLSGTHFQVYIVFCARDGELYLPHQRIASIIKHWQARGYEVYIISVADGIGPMLWQPPKTLTETGREDTYYEQISSPPLPCWQYYIKS